MKPVRDIAREIERPKEIAFENEIYLFWYEKLSKTRSDIFMSQSYDSGVNFAGPKKISDTDISVGDRLYRELKFRKNGDNLLFMFAGYLDDTMEKSELYFSQSIDNGQILKKPMKLSVQPDTENYGISISYSQNTIFVIWYEIDWSHDTVNLCLSNSRDSGNTFQILDKLPNTFASGVFSSPDRLYLVYEDMDPKTFAGHVFSMYSKDDGKFSKAVEVSTTDDVETSVTDFVVLSKAISIVWNEYPLHESISKLYSWSDNQGISYSKPKRIR
ncbi:MAG: hypothetical protein GEU26_06530 [Nitrososphaeraceae archaeon]|nr:hypothetical protein [Nitrososphaeraceae archaeon]